MDFDKKDIIIGVLVLALAWMIFGSDACPMRQACGVSGEKAACTSCEAE